MKQYRLEGVCNRSRNIACSNMKHNQHINSKCQITSHRLQCNGKQSTMCSYIALRHQVQTWACAVSKRPGYEPCGDINSQGVKICYEPRTIQYYPPHLCHLPWEIPHWEPLTWKKKLSTDINGMSELRVPVREADCWQPSEIPAGRNWTSFPALDHSQQKHWDTGSSQLYHSDTERGGGQE